MARLRVGCIGLGNLGRPVAERLLGQGFEVVVHNRSRGVVWDLVERGALEAWSPREVAARVDVVLTVLPYPATVEEVYLGPDGVLEGAGPGLLCLDLSTVRPALSRQLAAALAARSVGFLDAPVSGGPEGAAAGALAVMVGGTEAAFEQARPVLEALGKRIVHCGPAGAGAAVKLVNQVLIASHSAAAAEALAFAEWSGVDTAVALDLLGAGLAASALLARNGQRVLAGDFAPGARIGLFLKDLGLIREACDELGRELPVFFRSKQTFEQAFELGAGGDDLAGVIAVARASARWHDRQGEPERAALAEAAAEAELAPVALHEAAHDR